MRWLLLALMLGSLTACMGGSIAQQLASSFALRAADKITSNAYEAQLLKNDETRRNIVLKDTKRDDYWHAFTRSGFSRVTPTVEPSPAQAATEPTAQIQVTRLVRVEMWNLLTGREKHAVLEKARLKGAELPPPSQWQRWQVAVGAAEGEKNAITFLIPPEFGRLISGDDAMVELAGTGELNIARYPAN